MMKWIVRQFESFDFEGWICPGTHDCHIRIKARLVELHRRIIRNADTLEMLEVFTKIDEEEGDIDNNNHYWGGELPDGVCEDCDTEWKLSIPPIRTRLFHCLRLFFPTG